MSAADRRHSALVRDDEGGLQVRSFGTPETAAAASSAREFGPEDLSGLDPSQVRFAESLVKLLSARLPGLRPPTTDQVLTLEEAIDYTKSGNMWSFYKWSRQYRVRAITRGRYARRALDGGLRDECRGSGRIKGTAGATTEA